MDIPREICLIKYKPFQSLLITTSEICSTHFMTTAGKLDVFEKLWQSR